MATIRQRGKKWRAIVRMQGHNRSKSFDTEIEARVWAQDFEHDISSGDAILLGRTVKDGLERYYKEISPGKKGCRWEIIRCKKIARQPWTNIQLSDLTTGDLQNWIDNMPVSDGSKIREFSLMQSVLTVCRKRWKWMKKSPALDVDKPKRPAPRDRRIDAKETEAVLEALGYDPAASHRGCAWEMGHGFLLALETAMRRGEIWGLDWSDINLERRFLTLKAEKTKTATKRGVPLSTRAIELLKHLDPQPAGNVFKTSKASCDTVFRLKLKKAGIVDLHFHDTRHEALTRLAGKLTVLELARMVGHNDLRSLMIYYNATPEELAKKLD